MSNFTPWSSFVGGLLIGLAAVMLMALNGRIAGISGISAGVFSSATGDRLWRAMFLVGLLAAPLLYLWMTGTPPEFVQSASLPTLIIAGLLVGFGTQLGSGCTSGHGVCGISRLSPRSIVATLTFMVAGILTVTVARMIIEGWL